MPPPDAPINAVLATGSETVMTVEVQVHHADQVRSGHSNNIQHNHQGPGYYYLVQVNLNHLVSVRNKATQENNCGFQYSNGHVSVR